MLKNQEGAKEELVDLSQEILASITKHLRIDLQLANHRQIGVNNSQTAYLRRLQTKPLTANHRTKLSSKMFPTLRRR